MKKCFVSIAILFAAAITSADTGRLALNYSVGPNFIVGGDGAKDAGSVQPGVAAALQYGVSSNADFVFAYDYLHANMRSQALTFGGQYRLRSGSRWNPFVGAGLGFGKPYSGEGWDHFSIKFNGGLLNDLTSSISLAATLGYQYIDGSDPIGSVHAIQPALRMIFYFR